MPEESAAGPRPFWSGSLTFGLVNVPVRLFAATRSNRPSLRMVDEDGTPLERRYYCPAHERELSRDEIVRGYEVSEGKWVVVEEGELEALEPEKTREIDLRLFVPAEQLDPVFFQRPYILTPAEGATKAYRLLVRVMESSDRAGIATFVMRAREYLVAIMARDGLLWAETMRFHDEIRTPEMIGVEAPEAADGERAKEMVRAIEKAGRASIDESEMEDRRAEALEALAERKRRAGRDVREVPEAARTGDGEGSGAGDGRVIDLMEVLRRNLAGAAEGESGDGADGDGGGAGAGEPLESLNKRDLYERAKARDVPGRSSMTKDELVEALRRAG